MHASTGRPSPCMEMAEKEGAKYKDAYTKDAGAEPVWGQGLPPTPRTSLKAKRKEEEIRERKKKKRKEEE